MVRYGAEGTDSAGGRAGETSVKVTIGAMASAYSARVLNAAKSWSLPVSRVPSRSTTFWLNEASWKWSACESPDCPRADEFPSRFFHE